ncbi:oxidoreductase [Williamsoniiplasma somnilux]|uniref:Oxidoreductase n=1 Tax=Williamsoniiplasma somnilux TaxID=215578 RepID=A0A2K8NX74_9MOLU|nr:Gfo/Idh/MocA family oxidoreductase [Williamsoniiplasma somnilux]ATZ18419.1 oxidoreductase [Williamsoniiplasma somnilux]
MLKLATIGTSAITEKFIEAANQIKKLNIIAVSSRKRASAEVLIKNTNINAKTLIVEDWKELINIVDCVYIGTPNGTHYEIAKFLLDNNIHVLVEKTATFKVSEFKTLIQIAEKNNLILMEAFRPIHYPQYDILKDFKKNHQIVTVNLTQSSYSRFMDDVLLGKIPSGFDFNLGRGTTYDMLVYPVEIAIDLLGDVKHVKSLTRKLSNGVSVISNVLLEHENGILTTINNSKMSYSGIYNELATIDKTNLVFDNPGNLAIIELHTWKQKSSKKVQTLFVKDKNVNDMIYEIQNFVDMILDNNIQERNRLLKLTLKTIKILESIDKEIDY